MTSRLQQQRILEPSLHERHRHPAVIVRAWFLQVKHSTVAGSRPPAVTLSDHPASSAALTSAASAAKCLASIVASVRTSIKSTSTTLDRHLHRRGRLTTLRPCKTLFVESRQRTV